MAIAAIVLHCQGGPQELEKELRAMPCLVDFQEVTQGKIAATLESPSDKILEKLNQAANLPGVWNLELVYVNYEEDLDDSGHMKTPSRYDIKKSGIGK